MLLALLGATAGQGVVWYTGQFYALFFLTITLKVNYLTAYLMIAIALLIGTPFFIFFGWLSDRIGRLKIILAGCLIAALTYFPLFHGLTTAVNPAVAEFQAANPVVLRGRSGHLRLPHLRRPVVQVQRLRQVQGLSDQGRAVVHHRRCAGRDAAIGVDRADTHRWLGYRQVERSPGGGGLPARRPIRRASTGSWPR